jgi:Protein of unknown function (DUF3352)
MRRLLGVLVLAALAVAGCGSSSSGPSASGARNVELSYFPAGSPFVMSVVTDPNSSAVKQGQALVGRFPLAALGESALISKLQQQGIDYQGDIRPLFGNPIMFGVTGPTVSSASGSDYLVAWVTKDASKLTALIKKLPGVRSSGSHDGATLYQSGGSTTLAISGATAVLGPSPSAVTSALDRHAHGGGISSADYSRALGGLSQNALIQTFGNLTTALSSPSAAKARRVPWVAAFRSYAATVSASSSGLSFQYHLDTTGIALTSSQVPFATGTTAPNFAGTLPITVGIHDPAQIAAFAEAADQAASPSSYANFLKRQAAVRARTGADLNSLLRLLTGDLIIASDTHTTMGRAAVSDPATAASVLAKLATAPRSVFSKTTSVTRLGGGFYALKEPTQTIVVGVAGSELVVGKATPAQLRAFAAAPASPAAGAQGTVAFRVALVDLLHIALKQAPSRIEQTILTSLGDITGWSSASTSGITGSATLAFK